jgi:hypothetical protein
MVKKYGPLYVKGTIPAKAYPGQQKAAQVADCWNLLVVNEKMDEKLVYDVVKALFEHKKELAAVHAEAGNIELKQQYEVGSPVPFHPGAAKYFAEKGLKQKAK